MKTETPTMKFYGARDIDRLPQLQRLSTHQRHAMKVVAEVLPFRANNYVVEQLIDWDRVPDDPIFRLTFPQPQMLPEHHFARMQRAMADGLDKAQLKTIANEIRMELNPHPAGQKALNVPQLEGEVVQGVQRKYRETCLVFPSRGQTCHAYCTFCFRWPQFVGMSDLKFATDEAARFADFVREEKQLTDVLFTGGDPMVMKTKMLETYLERILQPGFEHIKTIRIGTKSVAYWPHRYTTDPDADDLMRLFERIVDSGKHLAIMGHYNHWMECSTPAAQAAIKRIRSTGAVIRTQSPLIRHINDSSDVWTKMWRTQVNLGCIPYYMFVERETGANHYFELPLVRAYEIFQKTVQQVSGLGRTGRGPSMSALPGKVTIDGIADIKGEKVFVLSFMQARNPDWVRRPFFAKYDPEATWLTDLEPAFGEREFFYEQELAEMTGIKRQANLQILGSQTAASAVG